MPSPQFQEIRKLRVRIFPGKYDCEKIKYTGLLAQEVEQAAKAANYDFSGCAAPKNQWGPLSYEQFCSATGKSHAGDTGNHN